MPESTERFLEAFAARSDLQLLQVTTSLEKRKRDELEQEILRWQQQIVAALRNPATAAPSGARLAAARTQAELLEAIEAIRLAREYLAANGNVAMICGMLSVRLR